MRIINNKKLRKSLTDFLTYKGYRIELNGFNGSVMLSDFKKDPIYKSHERNVSRKANLKFLTLICEAINKAEKHLDEIDVISATDFTKIITDHIEEKAGPNLITQKDEDTGFHFYLKNVS
jgi:hypothetical protein